MMRGDPPGIMEELAMKHWNNRRNLTHFHEAESPSWILRRNIQLVL